MASNEKNVCNVLRDAWRALIELVNFNSSFLRKILNEIQSLINRLKNTIIKRILSVIRDIKEIVSNFLGLQTIDNNLARNEFCKVLYACKPALEKIAPLISQELYDKIFGPDSIKTIDLSAYGIPSMHFASKFELFEYVACRLSLRGLLDSAVNTLTNTLLDFISQFDKYLDINWWLNNTVWGRVLRRLIKAYEDMFNNNLKPFLDELEKYMNCAFAICDFSKSTDNFLIDFSKKYKAERSQTTQLTSEWKIAKEELYGDLAVAMTNAKAEITQYKTTKVQPILDVVPKYTYKTDNQTPNTEKPSDGLPYTQQERQQNSNNFERKSIMTPGITDGKMLLRKPIVSKTQNSE